jgi:thymidylate kinase
MAADQPQRYRIIDASLPLAEVQQQISDVLEQFMQQQKEA